MTRSSWLLFSFGASALVHVVLGWRLYMARVAPPMPPARETFEVRMVTLPPPVPVAPPPEPPKPEPPKVEVAKPKPRPEPVKAPAPEPPVESPPAPVEPAPPAVTSAPPALLAESGAAVGGIVQIAGAPIGTLVTSAGLLRAELPRPEPLGAGRGTAPTLAKLSDLSRKPRAPALDEALRKNYPAELRRRGTEGQAEVRVVIDPRGHVGEIATVSESAAGFADACKRTLLGSRWSEPLDRDGQPVSTRLTYRCRFQIER